MDLPEALYRGLTGRSPTTAGAWRSVVADVRKAYPQATKPPPGISARTWQRIRADPVGRRSPAVVRALTAAQQALRFRVAWRRHARGKPIRLKGEVQVSGELRVRAVTVARWTRADPTELDARVISLMQEGEHAAAARLLTSALSEGVRQSVHTGETEWVIQGERGPGE